MLVGGLFLYISYYGCDQTQAQRILAARSHEEARRALAVASFVRFPLVCTYCLLGVLLGDLLAAEPAFAARLAGQPADALVPQFIAWALPVGVRGVAIAGPGAQQRHRLGAQLALSRAVRGGAGGSAGGQAGRRPISRRSPGEHWPSRGVRLLSKRRDHDRARQPGRLGALRADARGVRPRLGMPARHWASALAGVAAGVAVNLVLAIWVTSLSWLWWNVTGFAATVSGWRPGAGGGRLRPGDAPRTGLAPARLVARRLFAVILVLLAITLAL